MNHLDNLIGLIKEKKAHIGVIGLGYVGLPLVMRFCEEGFRVTGFDVDGRKVGSLNKGESYIKHIPSEGIARLVKGRQPLFKATADFSIISKADAVIICVPTPLSDKREPDLAYVEAAGKETARHLKPGAIVSLESTTWPGTTDEVLAPMFAGRGLKPGKDFFLVFSPEREDPGRRDYTTKTTPKIVGGVTPACARAGAALYAPVIERVVTVSSARAAEMSKLLENIYRSVNIALVNELKMLCDRMGMDVWEVIDAARTKPFGFQAFYPGPGLGGHCIPIDPFYLTWKAREFDFSTRFIELAGEINTNMPYYVVQKVVEALNDRGKSIKGSRIMVLGAAYKKDVDDMRESPSLELMRILMDKGARVSYNDPFVPVATGHKRPFTMRSTRLTEAAVKGSDCVLIATDHSSYDYKWIVAKSRLVVDTRNATKGIRSAKIVKA
ncbi:MAG: nucleotide sugar dehydrogenase [Deltaproteobacteria bacterium]|nr:nucleotide sugar dehydrogenase [Deltaproteobacteria bacterium]